MAGSGLDLRIKQDKLVRDKVVDALRQAILDGVLAPGRRLTEKELTELTGVSRTSVREALRGLQAEGLVEESPSRGLRVAVPTAEEIEQIYEVRAELEPLAVRLFVERASQGAPGLGWISTVETMVILLPLSQTRPYAGHAQTAHLVRS